MSAIDPYIELLAVLTLSKNSQLSAGYVRRDEIASDISTIIQGVLRDNAPGLERDRPDVVENLFVILMQGAVIDDLEDPIAGTYYKWDQDHFTSFRSSYISNNAIFTRASIIGSRFFPDVFAAYGTGNSDELSAADDVSVPAADRIVSLNHNQAQTIAAPLDELVVALEQDNGLPEHPGLRERLLGQMRAGRELIRAGEFRAYLLYVTLLRGLAELAAKYKDHAIGAAAGELIKLLIEQVFKA